MNDYEKNTNISNSERMLNDNNKFKVDFNSKEVLETINKEKNDNEDGVEDDVTSNIDCMSCFSGLTLQVHNPNLHSNHYINTNPHYILDNNNNKVFVSQLSQVKEIEIERNMNSINRLSNNTVNNTRKSSLNEKNNIYKARLIYLASNICFVFSTSLMKTFFEYNNKDGLIVLGFYRNVGVCLFFYFYTRIKHSNTNKSINNNTADNGIDNSNNEILVEDPLSNTTISLIPPSLSKYPEEAQYWMKVRIAIMITSMFTIFIPIKHLKMGISTVIFCLMPIFQNFFAYYLMGEAFQKKYVIAFIIAIFGVLIMFSKPKTSNNVNVVAPEVETYHKNTLLGAVCGIINSVIVGLMYSSVKIIGKSIDQFSINYISCYWSAVWLLVISGAYSLFFQEREILLLFDLVGALIGLGVGCIVGVCFYSMFIAFTLTDISKTSYITYVQIPFSVIAGLIFFGEKILLTELIGGTIVIGTILLVSVYFK